MLLGAWGFRMGDIVEITGGDQDGETGIIDALRRDYAWVAVPDDDEPELIAPVEYHNLTRRG